MADVTDDPEAAVVPAKYESNRIYGIMGNGKTFHFDFVDHEVIPGFEVMPGNFGFYVFSNNSAGVGGTIDRHRTLPTEDIDAASVVAVFVSEDNGTETVGIDSQIFQAKANLTG